MTLRFYIDDSGKNDPPVFVLGGVAIAEDRISAFENGWRAALAAAPAVPYLKMKDAQRGRGVFQGLSGVERNAKLAALGSVLREHCAATVAVIVRHDDYQRIFTGQMMHWMDHPYQMMFHLMIATAWKLCRETGIGETAAFVFDRQLEHEKALDESFPALMRGMGPEIAKFLLGQPQHADDREEIPLQAADMVAWHVRRSWRDGPGKLAAVSAAGSAIAALPRKHDLFDEKMLKLLAEVATATVRRLNTVFPYEAERISEHFDALTSYTNLELLEMARPFMPTELISFPASETGKYLLVRTCERLNRPHLHKRLGMRCLGAATAA